MSASDIQNEGRPTLDTSRKRACSGALQIGPRKKPYVLLLNSGPHRRLTVHQDHSGPPSAPRTPFWPCCSRLLQRADAHLEWAPGYVRRYSR